MYTVVDFVIIFESASSVQHKILAAKILIDLINNCQYFCHQWKLYLEMSCTI